MERTKVTSQAGFTLVEIMVVVVILGVLATMGFVGYNAFFKDANVKAASAMCKELEDATESYMMSHPEVVDMNGEDLVRKLVEDGYLKDKKAPKDPWKQDFVVEFGEDGNIIVYSKGADRTADTDDDVFKDGKRSDRDEDYDF